MGVSRRFIAFLILAMVSNIAAATTYVFTGTPYTGVSAPYSTSMRITGSFTTAAPLPANMAPTDIGPAGSNLVTSWSFNDGINTFTNLNSVVLFGEGMYFTVATDASGNVAAATTSIGFMSPNGTNTVGEAMNGVAVVGSGLVQSATVNAACNAVASGICTGFSPPGANTGLGIVEAAGIWAVQVASVSAPALSPALLALFAGWMLVLGLRAVRRSS